MPHPPVLRATLLGAACLMSLSAAKMPAQNSPSGPARPGPTRAINTDPKGPPIPAAPPVESAHPPSVPLWSDGAPGSESRRHEPEEISWRQEPDIVFPVLSNVHHPSLTPFLPPADRSTGCAVIIAPGGGHMQHTIDREGYDLARWLADRGIAAFVLKYRLARDGSNPPGTPQPYKVDTHGGADGSRAIRVIRANAAAWGVKPDRVGLLGFSAGGEIALLAASRHSPGDPAAPDPVERQSSRPDFFAPIYTGGLRRADLTWSKGTTPPAFLSCAYDDNMPEQMAALFTTLRQAGVNAELHIYSSGGHGYGVRPDRADLPVSTWHVRFAEWLNERGFLRK